MTTHTAPTPITIAVTRRVRVGYEADFEAALHRLIQASLSEPGQLGVQVLRPPNHDPNSPQKAPEKTREYGILRRFASEDARDAWFHSPLFQQWQNEVQPFVEGEPHYETISGLEGWFTIPGERSVVPPPKWKIALVSLLGVYPMGLLWPPLVDPMFAGLPPIAALLIAHLVSAALGVVALTWVVMPFLTHLLRSWLRPEPPTAATEENHESSRPHFA